MVAATAFAEDKVAARRLLDSAAEMVSAASLEIQVSSRMHIGEYYAGLDRAKVLRHFEEAFALTASLLEDGDTNTRSAMQAEIVKVAAGVDLALAIDLIRRGVEPVTSFTPRNEAIAKVVEQLLLRKQLNKAIEVIGLIPQTSEHPFEAVGQVLERLPKDDPRRIVLFGNATKAYIAHSSGPFPAVVAKYWREVPEEMANSAIRAIVKRLLDTSDKNVSAKVVITGEESVELRTWQTQQFAEIYDALRSLDPKRAAEVVAERPEIRRALKDRPAAPAQENPETQSEEPIPLALLGGITKEADIAEHFRLWDESARRARLIMNELEKSPEAALARVAEIPLASLRTEMIAQVARAQARRKNAEGAKATLEKALHLVSELKVASDRIQARLIIADAAHQLKESKIAWEALEGAFADAEEMYKGDVDPKGPNKAMREHWPSINGARMVAWSATKMLGVQAEPLLANMQNPDLLLAAKIDMAAAHLGKSASVSLSTSIA